jgi:hypothetical protein
MYVLELTEEQGTILTPRQLDQSKDGKWSIGIAVIIRVTLKDGTFHEVRPLPVYSTTGY